MPDETRHESEDLEDYQVQDSTDTLSGAPGNDPLDRGVVPPERWSAGVRYGVTEQEQEQGESLDQLLAEEEPDPALQFEDDDEDDEDEDDDDAADEDVDGLLLDDGPDPRAGWWPRTRGLIRTTKRTWWPPTSASMAAARPRRKRPSTWSRRTTTTSARSSAARRARCRPGSPPRAAAGSPG